MRRYVLRTTPAATKVLVAATPEVDVVGDELLAPLSAGERRTLMALLDKLVAGRA